MGRISRNLCIFLLLLLVVPTVYAEPKTEIRMEILPVSSADDTGDLSISANFTVLFTNSTTYTKPDGSTQIVPAEQRSLNNAKVYFSISDLGSSRYIPLGGGQAYAADTQVDAKMSDGTTETLYYGFHTIFGIDSNYSGKCALVKAEFKGESDDPDPNIGNAVAVQEVCFGTQSMPSMLTFLITNELMNPENSPLCIPFLLLIIFAGGAFYFRGGSMVHLLDFAQPRLPKLHEVRFKYGGYGWHGLFKDATSSTIGELKDLKKNLRGLTPKLKADIDELIKLLKKDQTGLAGILASGRLAGMSMDELRKFSKLAGTRSTDQIYGEVRDFVKNKKDLDNISKSALLAKMKVFLEGNAKAAYGKANVREMRGLHGAVVKGAIGDLSKGNMMGVLLAPMKYAAGATGKAGKAVDDKFLSKVAAKDSTVFRKFNEPLHMFLARLNAGGYVFRPIFNLYFLALPNFGKWKDKARKSEWARNAIGLTEINREDGFGRISIETMRRNVPRMIEAIDRENTTFLVSGILDKVLNDKKAFAKLGIKDRELLATLNALKGSDLMNVMSLEQRVNVLAMVMNKLKVVDKDRGKLLEKLADLINKEHEKGDGGLNFGKYSKYSNKYLSIAEEVFKDNGGRKSAEYRYLNERVSKIALREGEMKNRGTIVQNIVCWKLNSIDLDKAAKDYNMERTAFKKDIASLNGSARYMIGETFYSLAKVSKNNASLANAFGMVYLEQIYNNYGFLPNDKNKIRAILKGADDIAIRYLPPKSQVKDLAKLSDATLDKMASNLSKAMGLANEIAERMINKKEFSKLNPELRKLAEKDGNYLIFFNGRALKQEIEKNDAIGAEDKKKLLNSLIFGEEFKNLFSDDVKTYLFGQQQRQNPSTYLEGKHWAYVSERDKDPYAIVTHYVPGSKEFEDKGEAEQVGKMVSFWNVMFRRQKGVFKKGGESKASMEKDFFSTLVAEGAGNDDRNFIKFSNRTTTIQGINILEFAKRQIHTVDFVIDRLKDKGGFEGVIKEMRDAKNNEKFASGFESIGADPKDVKKLLDKKSLNGSEKDRLKSYALNYYLFVSENSDDNRLVKFGEVKKDKDFIYMTGEQGDYNPLRTHLDRMNSYVRDIVTNKGSDRNLETQIVKNSVQSDLHFVKTAVPKAATEKAVNMKISYIGEHGHIYRSITDLAESYKNIKDREIRLALNNIETSSNPKYALAELNKIKASGNASKEEIAIAAFRYGQKTGNYEELFNADNVRFGSFAEVEAQRKERLRSTEGLAAWEIPFAKLMHAKERTIDSFVNMHENVVYRNALRIGNQDLFGMENQENRIMKESFAVLDEYKALNSMKARMEHGDYNFDLVKRFSNTKEAEAYVAGRMTELRNSYDAFEWFMTRDVHPIYGGSYPHLREGLVSASFNAGLSTLKPAWVDQMLESYGAQNYDNYPILGHFMKKSARYLINFNLKLQEPFVLMMRAEDKMSRGIPNPYELKYEYNNDIERNMEELGADRSFYGRRFVEQGSIKGPGDQLMTSESMGVPYTVSSFVSNLAKVPLLPISTLVSLAETRKSYKSYSGAGQGIVEPVIGFADKLRSYINSVAPMEGSAVADSEEKWIAKRPPSHFSWHSGEFGTPGDLPGREHFFWGSGKRQIEPGQMWKLYSLHGLDTEENTRSLQDLEGLDYASLSIRKRASNIVDDYFKREQEATWFAPSRHPIGIMSNPLFLYNWVSSTTGKWLGDKVVEPIQEKGWKEGSKKIGIDAAKFVAGAPFVATTSLVSNSLNLVAVGAGGTNYLVQCPACGAIVKRDAPNCPMCHRKYEIKP